MLKKGSKIHSILFGVCPKCHKESMYVIKNPYRLYDTLKMHERCRHCATKYKIEPSFFYGSMYVSYALGVAVAVAVYVLLMLFGLGKSALTSFLIITGVIILMSPYIYQLSKVIWASFFIPYDPKKSA